MTRSCLHRSALLWVLLAAPLVGAACQARPSVVPTPDAATEPGTTTAGPRWTGAPARVGTTARRGLRTLADSLLDDRVFRSAHWGVLVVDPVHGDTLYSRNSGKLFMPASNQKLVTGAVALAVLGADYRWETRVLGAASPVDGVLTGDLAVVAAGDPTWSDSLAGGDVLAPMRAFADSLHARGIREVTGRLLRGADHFPDSTLGYGWAWDDLDYSYSAPVDELFFNEGYATITVVGGAIAGQPVQVRRAPSRVVPELARVDVVTADTGRSRVQWTADVRGARPALTLTGRVRAGDSVTVDVALRDPAGAWLDAFAEVLLARGIVLRGGVDARSIADTTGMVTLASRRSPPLAQVLARFEKPSQNQIGELLFKTLGLHRTGVGTADSGRVVVERQLVAWGIDSAGFAVRDGSGLSRHDYLTPETVLRVLDTMRRHPDFRVFYDALPVAGREGTLRTRMRGSPAEGNLRAKTGTLDKARALSGYLTSGDGRLLLVSMLANNHVVPNREVERVQDAIAVWLAGTALDR